MKRTPYVTESIVEREKHGRFSSSLTALSDGIRSRAATPRISTSNSVPPDNARYGLIASATESSALLRGGPIRESGDREYYPSNSFDGLSSSLASTTTTVADFRVGNGGVTGLTHSEPSIED